VVFLGPRANAELVPKFHVAQHTSHAALPMVALEISHCTNMTSQYGDLVLQVGGVSDETVKYAVSSAGLRPKSDCSGKAQKQLYSKLQTCPLLREGATKLQTRNCLKEISRRKKNWSQVPDACLTPGQTGRLIVGHKLRATATEWYVVSNLRKEVLVPG
jgi:hypothetical protein